MSGEPQLRRRFLLVGPVGPELFCALVAACGLWVTACAAECGAQLHATSFVVTVCTSTPKAVSSRTSLALWKSLTSVSGGAPLTAAPLSYYILWLGHPHTAIAFARSRSFFLCFLNHSSGGQ